MVLRSDTYYRQLAEDAIRNAGVDEPPISVEGLAQHFAIPVRMVAFPGFFYGAIINEDGLPVILLNSAKEELTRRKTLAHLLGHVLIVLDDPESVYPRNTQSEHREANKLADELVVPAFMLSDQAAKWFNDHRYLARLFAVEENELLQKMYDMGLIKQQGIMWDY